MNGLLWEPRVLSLVPVWVSCLYRRWEKRHENKNAFERSLRPLGCIFFPLPAMGLESGCVCVCVCRQLNSLRTASVMNLEWNRAEVTHMSALHPWPLMRIKVLYFTAPSLSRWFLRCLSWWFSHPLMFSVSWCTANDGGGLCCPVWLSLTYETVIAVRLGELMLAVTDKAVFGWLHSVGSWPVCSSSQLPNCINIENCDMIIFVIIDFFFFDFFFYALVCENLWSEVKANFYLLKLLFI